MRGTSWDITSQSLSWLSCRRSNTSTVWPRPALISGGHGHVGRRHAPIHMHSYTCTYTHVLGLCHTVEAGHCVRLCHWHSVHSGQWTVHKRGCPLSEPPISGIQCTVHARRWAQFEALASGIQCTVDAGQCSTLCRVREHRARPAVALARPCLYACMPMSMCEALPCA